MSGLSRVLHIAAAAAALSSPPILHADIAQWRRSGEGTVPRPERMRYRGGEPRIGERRRRILAYKRQRAANRLRRKLEARR